MKDWCAAGSCSEEKDKELQVGINAHLFITNVLRHCGWGLFHGNKCQDLEQMILHHVSETANSCLLYWAKEMAPWPTEDKLHPSPAYVNYPMYIVLQLIVSPDPKTSSIPFSSLHYHPIPKPTVYPSLAYIIPWSNSLSCSSLHYPLIPKPTVSPSPAYIIPWSPNSLSCSSLHYPLIPKPTISPSPAYIIFWSPSQQFILLHPTLSPDPQNDSLSLSSLYYPLVPKTSLSCSSLHYPLIPKPTVYLSPAYIIPWSQNSLSFSSLHYPLIPKPVVYPSPVCIIVWS